MNTSTLFYIIFVLLCLVFFIGLWAGTTNFQDLPERIRQPQPLDGFQGSISLGGDIPFFVLISEKSESSQIVFSMDCVNKSI